ncbi:hypothetical protein [Paraburkholderia rhizosphaerae]|uniref:Uncharacterized protein n=1 Tax=Paraburkholderia rhizosphaerae TaxID=480658 RepID=A0A4R8LXD6_9BURK|nr:hypothetical protein [Paraburkholderia rhizosphaerae]TDY52342.1 hypothetical protein BX592_105226 [Paraburkholderia rhizosphaerae]
MRKLVLIATSAAALALMGGFTSASAQSTGAQPSAAQPTSAGASSGTGSGEGPGTAGMTASGKHRSGWPWYSQGNNSMNCVGPISFCNVYFGGG